MRKYVKKILCIALALCVLSSTFAASAALDASSYLSRYSATLTAKSGGKIAILVDVTGAGYMTDIGATDIYVYESSDNVTFTCVSSFHSDAYPRMLGSGSTYFDTPITYAGTPGMYYYASVYFYAADSTGSDTGHYNTDSCRAIS